MSNVTAAKPGVGGGIWMAPKGSTMPTDAGTALDNAFASLGYVDENGVTRKLSLDTKVVKAWGGDVVAVIENGKTETFKLRLIDVSSLAVLGLTFGEATGDLNTGITAKSNTKIRVPHAFVISMLEADDVHHRIAIPEAVVTDIGDIKYVDNDVIGCDLTLTAIADSAGNTAYDYMQTIAGSDTST